MMRPTFVITKMVEDKTNLVGGVGERMDELGEHAMRAGVEPSYALHYTVRCIATNTHLHTYINATLSTR